MLIRTSTNRKTALLVVGFLLTSMAVFFVAGNFAHAQTAQQNLAVVQQSVGFGNRDIRDIIVSIVKVFIGFLGLVAVMIVLYGGYLYMTSGGDTAKIQKAKDLLKNGAIGVIIIFSAYSIVSFLFRALGVGYGTQYVVQDAGQPGGFGGALGNGIIQAHLPGRGATDVPRNTSILVTFKEEMDRSTLIKDNAATLKDGANIIYGNCNTAVPPAGPTQCDTVNTDHALNTGVHVLILKREDYDNNNLNAAISGITAMTNDGKTFVFNVQPQKQLLGNSVTPQGYVVILGNGLKKLNGDPAFATLGCSATLLSADPANYAKCKDYVWSFEVSTKLDVTPPTVVSVIPQLTNPPANNTDSNQFNNKVARNAIIQINFSEAVNPLTVTGETPTFNLMQILNLNNAGAPLAGKFEISNQYKTVEFTTNDPCGINSCGEQIFCLPALSAIQLLAKSATLASTVDLPFASVSNTGVSDVCENALDGNANGTPDGSTGKFDANINYQLTKTPTLTAPVADPTCTATQFVSPTVPNGDNYQMAFCTNESIDLVPPQILNYSPIAGAVGVDPIASLSATFDKNLSASTVKQDSGYGDGFCGCASNSDCVNDATHVQVCNLSKGYCEDNKVPTNKQKVTCYRYDGIPQCQSRTITIGGTSTVVGDEQVCVEKEHITLENPVSAPSPVGYWTGTENTTFNDGGVFRPRGITTMDHVKFFDQLDYGIRYGSGIKDLYQNCYTPSAAPGCARLDTTIPGQYDKVTGQWLGTFPNCDLTQTTLTTHGLFNLSYETAGVNKTSSYQAWEWDKPVGELYDYKTSPNYSSAIDSNDYFKGLLQPDTTTFFMYHYVPTTNTAKFAALSNADKLPSYYLYVIGGKNDPNNTAQHLSFDLSTTNSSLSLSASTCDSTSNSTAPCVIMPETSTVAPALNVNVLRFNPTWPATQTDGYIYKLGNSDNFNLAVNFTDNLTVPLPKVRFAFPGGSVDLPNNKPFSMLTVDRQPPVANALHLTAAATISADPLKYDVKVIWDSRPTVGDGNTDIAEAFVDIVVPELNTNKILAKSSLQLNDQGTGGDVTANDNIWSASFTVDRSKVSAADFAPTSTAAQVQLNTSTRDYAGNYLGTSTTLKNLTVTPAL